MPPIADVPITDFMDTLKHIDNKYNNNFPLWPIIVITICFILVLSLLMALLVCLKCANKCNQYFTQCKEKNPEASTVQMMFRISTATNPDIHTKVQKALEEKGINPRAYEKYPIRMYGKKYEYNVMTKEVTTASVPFPQDLEHIIKH